MGSFLYICFIKIICVIAITLKLVAWLSNFTMTVNIICLYLMRALYVLMVNLVKCNSAFYLLLFYFYKLQFNIIWYVVWYAYILFC